MKENVDVLVIGAGPSGTIAASIVNQNGFNVKIVEKTKFPRFVIGESLLPKCMEALDEAKFLDALKLKGFQQKSGAKFVRNNEICDFNFDEQFTQGWNWTYQAPRADFDKTLADEVQKQGVEIEFETEVTGIEFNGSDSVTTVKCPDGSQKEISARFIIDASGYGRVIPKLFNLDKPSNLPVRKTLFAHMEDTNRNKFDEPDRIIVVAHTPDTWIWVIPFSNGNTSVGFVASPEFFEKYTGSPEEKFRALIQSEAYINERFKNQKFIFEPRTIEGWSVSTEKFFGDGFVLTGNVTEFLDPIFSSGVTLAAVSGQIAAKLVCRELNGERINWEKEYLEPVKQGVNTFRSYVMAWYDGTLQDVFFAPDQVNNVKQQICSVLAGYVWDQSNSFVKKHDSAIKTLAKVIRLERE